MSQSWPRPYGRLDLAKQQLDTALARIADLEYQLSCAVDERDAALAELHDLRQEDQAR